ncbi:MAG: GTP cyclohydrolase [Candidatus Paracaedibacteraceae bacterium]|nr:GTP cyclohydrolase [Candidatus Paracaedibacteraceae bacterium]
MSTNLFIIKITYTAPIEEIDIHLADHRAYLDQCYAHGHYLVSGPQIPRTGGIIIAQGSSQSDIDKLMANDPFTIHGLIEYELTRFEAVKSIDTIKDWLK